MTTEKLPSELWRTWINEPPAWVPSHEAMQKTLLGQFLTQQGMTSVQELRERAAQDPAWFWQTVEQELQWPWFRPYHTILDLSYGKPWAKWFVGGTTNWVAAIEREARSARKTDIAVVEEIESGEVRTWTYCELVYEADRLAQALHSRWGVKSGDTVGMMLPMIGEAAIALIALAKLGAIAVPLFSGYGVEAVFQRLNDAQTRYVIVADGVVRRGRVIPMKSVIDAVADKLPINIHVITIRHVGLHVTWAPQRDIWWDELLAESSANKTMMMPVPVSADAPCLLLYTSGTTGRPKGTVHGHAGFPLKAAQDLWHVFDVGDADVLLWITDLGWMMGPWAIIGGLLRHATVVLYDGAPDYPTAQRLWQLVMRHQVTVMGLAPTLVRSLMAQASGAPLDPLPTIRVLGSTGEPWDPESWYWFFHKVGGSRCPIINYSGGTEIGGGILGGTVLEPIFPCSFSGPVPGMDAVVVDDAGQPVQNTVGELVIKQPWPGMTQGFWRSPDRYLDTYWQRWPNFWTHGDWAVATNLGAWFILGRTDDTMKIAGKRVGPAEVEAVLMDDPYVVEAAVIGLPDPVKGEVLAGFVVALPEVSLPPEWEATLCDRVAISLGRPLRPTYMKVVPALPKTRNGKIMRRVLREVTMGIPTGDLSGLDNPGVLADIPRLIPATQSK